jgi:hypothetical protein
VPQALFIRAFCVPSHDILYKHISYCQSARTLANIDSTKMRRHVHVQLDRRSHLELEELVRRLGWSPSRVVCEGIHLLAARVETPSTTKVIGTGRFASGLPDLGSNKKHLKGFG